MSEISAVGHRIVHGGEKFKESAIIDEDVMKAIRDCVELAPLHNPSNIIGIEACNRYCPMCRWLLCLTQLFIDNAKACIYLCPPL